MVKPEDESATSADVDDGGAALKKPDTIFRVGNIAAILLALFLFQAFKNLSHLADPMKSYDGDQSQRAQLIKPLWQQGQKFHLYAFLSRSSRFNAFRLSDLMERKELLLHRESLVFTNDTHEDLTMHLRIIEEESRVGKGTSGNGSTPESPLEVVASNQIWTHLRKNSTSVFLHVLALKTGDEHNNVTSKLIESGRGLYGVVRLLKHDKIQKSQLARYLLHDWADSIRTLLPASVSSYLLREMTPQQRESSLMPADSVLSFWKPEVSIRTVHDWTEWPTSHAPESIFRTALPVGKGKKQEYRYPPALHADEIGLTSDKYVPVNATVTSLPLSLTYGGMSLSRWLIMQELGHSLQAQKKDFGFTDKDMDDVRRLISETSVWLLGVTAAASMLHLIFEILAFQSDIAFWKENTSLAGLSARAVIIDLFSQFIVLLYLIDNDTSLLVTLPAGAGVLIQLWKVKRATGLTFTFTRGFQLSRLHEGEGRGGGGEEEDDKLIAATFEADKMAAGKLILIVTPLLLANSARSLVLEMHTTWYSWFITSLTASVYAFGFALMVPQLYINHQLKSVSRLPWRFLVYKFINTFIDDLFAFVIKMPTMHRLSVFRDDIIFVVYLYQRYIYAVDERRPLEK